MLGIDAALIKRKIEHILSYLEESGKIAQLKEGIIWIYKDELSPKLKAKLKKGVTVL